jgi:hypothetical protein
MTKEGKQFLVVLQLGKADVQRLQSLVPKLKKHLESLSNEPIEQVFRSVSADIFGYAIRSKLAAGQIAASIETPERDSSRELTKPPFLDSRDHVLVLELGEDFQAGPGFTRFGTWLQRH